MSFFPPTTPSVNAQLHKFSFFFFHTMFSDKVVQVGEKFDSSKDIMEFGCFSVGSVIEKTIDATFKFQLIKNS